MASSGRRTRREGAVHVGDRARFRFVRADYPVEVIEDRGPLGIGGGQIVRVRVLDGSTEEPREFEVPVEELTDIQPGPRRRGYVRP